MKVFRRDGWSNREDEVLKAAISKYGKNNWGRVASMLRATGKTPQQCEARWYEYLSPTISHAEWTKDEDAKLLTLVETWGSNWRTIAQQLPGRTPAQCQQQHGLLLDQARSQATGGAARVRFAQTDHRGEVKAARKDTIDEDHAEKLMLDEVRARLANTQGRKGLRKQRERALQAAKQRAEVQHHREMRAAAAAVGTDVAMEDEEFVPIATSDVDGKKNKVQQQQQRQKQQQAASVSKPSEQKAAASASSSFSFSGKPTLLAGDSATSSAGGGASAAGTTTGGGMTQKGGTLVFTSATPAAPPLVVPKSLQEKRAKAAKKASSAAKTAAAVATKKFGATAVSATTSSSRLQQQQQQQLKAAGQVTDAVAAAIRDGGRTRRQNEALVKFGASSSFPQWCREQRGMQLPLPTNIERPQHHAAPSMTMTNREVVVDAERLIMRHVAQLVEADRTSASASNNSNAMAASAPPPPPRSGSNKKDADDHSILLEGSQTWLQDCANKEVADAAKLIDEEFEKSNAKASIAVMSSDQPPSCDVNKLTADGAAVASALVQHVVRSDAWKSAQRLQTNLAAPNGKLDEHSRVCAEHEQAQTDAMRSANAVNVTNSVRLWEEQCLQAAYTRAAAELRDAKVQNDAATAAMLA